MGAYMGLRIVEGAFTFTYVISKRPDLQDGIEQYLKNQGRDDLIQNQSIE